MADAFALFLGVWVVLFSACVRGFFFRFDCWCILYFADCCVNVVV